MMAKSYFAILGVLPNASSDEIRAAYRRLAKAYHPDHFPGGSGPFMEIQEAYAVLGDSRKRQAYQDTLEAPAACRQAPTRTYGPNPFRKRPARATPEPLIPGQHADHGNPLMDVGPGSPNRFHRVCGPSLDDILEWLFGHPFGPRRG